MVTQRPNVLKDAQDITIVGHPEKNAYVFAAKTSLAFQNWAYNQALTDTDDRIVPAFKAHWQFDESRGITGSNVYLDLRLDKLALRPLGLWLPGLQEGRILDKQGKLENGVYRGEGLAVITSGNSDEDHSQTLSALAGDLNLELPLVVPFRALDYVVSGKKIKLSFSQGTKSVTSGEEAARQIKSLDYKGDTGVLRLIRGARCRYADWSALTNRDTDDRIAIWSVLASSNWNGRGGDWVCGEATRENLVEAYNTLNARRYGEKIQILKAEQESTEIAFLESLED